MDVRAVTRQRAFDKAPGVIAGAAPAIQSDGQDDDDPSPVADNLFGANLSTMFDLFQGLNADGIEQWYRTRVAKLARAVLSADILAGSIRPRMPSEPKPKRGKKRGNSEIEAPDTSSAKAVSKYLRVEAERVVAERIASSSVAGDGSQPAQDDFMVDVTKLTSDSAPSSAAQGSDAKKPKGPSQRDVAYFGCFFRWTISPPSADANYTTIQAKADLKAVAAAFAADAAGTYKRLCKVPGQACEELMQKLNDIYAEYYIRVTDQSSLKGTYKSPSNADATVDLFQKMGIYPASDLNKMIAAGFNSAALRPQNDFRTVAIASSIIRVPTAISIYLYEIGRSTVLFQPAGDDGGGKPMDTSAQQGTLPAWQGVPLPAGQAAMYRLDPGGAFTPFAMHLPGTGIGGGGGEFRTDPATEFTYRWHYLQPVGSSLTEDALVAACGLRRDWRLGDDAADPGSGYQRVVTPIAGLAYWRQWTDPLVKVARRNSPITTIPIAPLQGPTYNNAPAAFGKTDLATRFAGVSFKRKSRKGAWDRGMIARDSIPLRRQGARDDSAGSVMNKALLALNVPNAKDLNGSATDYVGGVLAGLKNDATSFWRVFSNLPANTPPGPKVRAGRSETNALTMLRTEQEWCHLIGHGDGGDEVLENFVSGSKHANSEQLAIESGQRPWFRDAYVSAKVTAFMLPVVPIERTDLTKVEIATLTAAGFVRSDFTPFKTLRDKLKGPLDLYNGSAASAVRDAALVEALPKGSRAQYVAIKDKEMAATWLRKRADELSPMLALPQPIAFGVRYRVYVALDRKKDSTKVRVIDHFIQMQRESFDVLEYRFLFWSTQLKIAAAIDALVIAANNAIPPAPPSPPPNPDNAVMSGPADDPATPMMDYVIDKMSNASKATTPPVPKAQG